MRIRHIVSFLWYWSVDIGKFLRNDGGRDANIFRSSNDCWYSKSLLPLYICCSVAMSILMKNQTWYTRRTVNEKKDGRDKGFCLLFTCASNITHINLFFRLVFFAIWSYWMTRPLTSIVREDVSQRKSYHKRKFLLACDAWFDCEKKNHIFYTGVRTLNNRCSSGVCENSVLVMSDDRIALRTSENEEVFRPCFLYHGSEGTTRHRISKFLCRSSELLFRQRKCW